MKGLFCEGCKARNNEEYIKVLKQRQKKVSLLFAAGLVTMLIGILAWKLMDGVADKQFGIISGFGGGLTVGATLSIINIRSILKSEERLKQNRLLETDERENEVSSRAMRTTAKIVLAVLYIMMIAGGCGLFAAETMAVCSVLIAVFLLSYVICRIYYQRIM